MDEQYMQGNEPESREKLAYRSNISRDDKWKVFKATAFPAVVMLIVFTVIGMFGKFGTGLVSPLVALMWCMGTVTAFLLPSHRNNVLTETMGTIIAYLAALAGFRILLSLVSGVSTQMLIASFDQPISMSSSNALPGYIQTAIWITTGGVPLGFFGMQVKRLIQFRKTANKQKTFEKLRDIRKNNR